MKKVLFVMGLLIACHWPPAQGKESAMMKDADRLFTEGKYDSALEKYDALQKNPPDERDYSRALFRATECEILLAQHEKALDRVRTAKLPSDPGLRAIVNLGRLETFRGVKDWYGFSEETEEGAVGSAKLSRAAADREMESSAQALWKDRDKLARLSLTSYAEYFVLADADFARYPSLWDFAVLRLHQWLEEQRGRVDVMQFVAEDFPRTFDAGQPALARIGALYEESAHLDGGSVDRAMAAERWRVARVMLASDAQGMSQKRREAWHAAAVARLKGWANKMQTPLGRADAAAKAAGLLYDKQRVEALLLIEATLPRTPESEVAVELRQLRHNILDKELNLATRVTRDGKKAIQLGSRNLRMVWMRLYPMDPMRDGGNEFWSQSLIAPPYDKVEGWIGGRHPLVEWKVATGDKGDHMDVHQELDAPAQGVGLYLAVASDEGRFAVRKSILRAAFVNVTDIAVARAETEAGLRYYAFNADTREPASDVAFRMLVSTDRRSRATDRVKTDREGVGTWAFPSAPYLQVDAMAEHGKAIALFPSPVYHGTRNPEPKLELFLAGDRPVYRPGQIAKVRVTSVERVKDGSFKVDARRKIHLSLHDPNGKEAATADVVTGPMGSASAEFTLPLKGLLGVHNIAATVPGMSNVSRNLSVRVEEYKRPEFEVTLDAPRTATKYGNGSKLTGSVKYYFGGAASDVPVKFKVSRRRWIPWWLWRQGQSPKVEIARGDVKTDKTGNFTIEFVAAPDPDNAPSEDEDMPDVSDFIVEVEAHDTGGRTIAVDRSLRVGAQSMLVTGEAARLLLQQRGRQAQGQDDESRGAAGRGRGDVGARAAGRAQRQAGRGAAAAGAPEEVPGGRGPRRARHAPGRRQGARGTGAARTGGGWLSPAAQGGRRQGFVLVPRRGRQIGRPRAAAAADRAASSGRVSAGRQGRVARRRQRRLGRIPLRGVARLDADRTSRGQGRGIARVDGRHRAARGGWLHRAVDRCRWRRYGGRRRDASGAAKGQGADGQARG